EDAGYSYDGLKEKVLDFKDKTSDTLDRTGEIYQDGKEKYEDIKDKTDERLDDLKDLDVKSREELDKTAPRLIAD
ncbi:MAG: YtxH domain-containing protein, partial [Victivallaceae bacterium]|nr:YtxH domain-containing protein [Victivallaceae bacterium]